MNLIILFSALWALSSAAPAPAPFPEFVFEGDPSYNVSSADLRESLICPNGMPNSNDKPVLLVHGTGSTGDESWGRGYVPALAKAGHKACYLNLRENKDCQCWDDGSLTSPPSQPVNGRRPDKLSLHSV